MPKFSIIVPVYNVEKYIVKCLDSIKNQSFKDYEVIVVNDGSTDNSMELIKDYKVKVINQENKGLSEARNRGVKEAKGEYLLFVDSDDYIEENLLSELSKAITEEIDIIRFQAKTVSEEGKILITYNEEAFDNINGYLAFSKIVNYHFVENAWLYLYRREFYMNNKFSFAKGMLHEDFGIVPLIVMKAKNVKAISYVGYNYRLRRSSIMNMKTKEKIKKKVDDFYNHYKFLVKEIDKTNLDSKVFKSFIANSLIIKICELTGNDYKYYKNILKKENVFAYLLDNTFMRKVKKVMFKVSPKITVSLFIK